MAMGKVRTLCRGASASMLGVGMLLAPCSGAEHVRASSLDQAMLEFRAGHTEQAAAQLQHLTAAEPRNAAAWRALGTTYLKLKQTAPAIAALHTARELEPAAARTLFQLGVAYAVSGDIDAAVAWLREAKATGRYDMTELSVDDRLAALRADAHFTELLPRAQDFEHPFVEPVKIIREWRGEAAGDQFGWIARPIGDVDGDGVVDIVTSAPTHGEKASHAGRVYVYSVGSGRLLWSADGQPGDELGSGLEGIGDTDGDGIPDVIASGPSGPGVVFIYSGHDGRVLQSLHALRSDELFGNHISGMGDVNGDGYPDLIVGAPGKDDAKDNPGHAYVYSGHSGELLATLHGERSGDQFGSAVAARMIAGKSVIVVGAPLAGADRHGRVYVYDGRSMKVKFTIEADATASALGAMFLAVMDDWQGEGRAAIYASDWSNNALGTSTGRIYLHSASTGKRLWTLTGETAGDGFGTSPSVAGDVDGDGHGDLIVGAWQYGGAAVSGGRAYLYSGRTHVLLRTYTCRIPGDTFGFDAVGLGDVDGDGVDDLLITSGWSAVSGNHSGRVFIISSGVAKRNGRKPARLP